MVPMRAPVLVGWVVMGFPLDQALADEMRRLLSVQVALVVQEADGRVTVPVSTLSATLRDQIVAQGGQVDEIDSPDGVLLSRSSPLPSVNGQVQALLLRWWWLPIVSCSCCWQSLPLAAFCSLRWAVG